MNYLTTKIKGKHGKKKRAVKDAVNEFIQPFKEMPSVNISEKESTDRIDAHDLFSFYTSDIIKKDIVYAR